jgi:hypothetical protein
MKNKIAYFGLLAFFGLVLGVASLVFLALTDPMPTFPNGNKTVSPSDVAPKSYRTVTSPFYGFIRGGILSVDEFRMDLKRDSALAMRFGGFDFNKARFEHLAKAECVYIAYRRGNSFAWTKGCKLLPAGTLILTDGNYRIRAACGNLISNTPEVPIIPAGHEPTVLDPDPETTAVPDLTPVEVQPNLPGTPISVQPPTSYPPVPLPITPIGCCVPPPTHVSAGDSVWELFLCILLVALALVYRDGL